jgi:uncharacterized protein (DUF934 family)
MAHLIKHRQIVHDSWLLLNRDIERLLRPGEDGLLPDFPDQAKLIVPTALWRSRREDLLDRTGGTGVWLDSSEEPGSIAEDLPLLAVVAVNFPQFTDGRGYSTARLLRERYSYRGELRAIGDVLRDQLPLMERCGFDAFALREGPDPDEALRAFNDFIETYQASATQPEPLFRVRLASAATP